MAHIHTRSPLSRRTLLKATGVALALPWLETMAPRAYGATSPANAAKTERRFVAFTMGLGLHADYLFPDTAGADYKSTRYLQHIDHLRSDFTVVSGVSHPGVSNGHTAVASILTGKKVTPGSPRNDISLDQLMASKLGHTTRYPSLVLSTSNNTSPSYTANGSMIPAEDNPARLFARLFLADSPAEQQRQIANVQEGRSILDVVMSEAKKLQHTVGVQDAAVLDDYYTGVRELEKQLQADQSWITKPKPAAKQPQEQIKDRDFITQQQRFLAIMALALQSNSTKFMTLSDIGQGNATSLPEVKQGYHPLSHHGLAPEKIAQLALIQDAQVKSFGVFLGALKNMREGEGSALDATMVLLTSNLGNASSHDCRNMPVIFAGGGFKHGKHLAFDRKNNYPMANLYLSALHRLGIEAPSFATSTGTMTGLEFT